MWLWVCLGWGCVEVVGVMGREGELCVDVGVRGGLGLSF